MRKFTKIIGACCHNGQTKLGTHIAPQFIHKKLGQNVDIDFIDNFDNFGAGYKDLYSLHNKYLHENNKVTTLGGDHSISLSTTASSVEKFKDDLVVVWVDAHPDLNTRQSSLTKNIHGMPVASLLGLDNLFDLPTINPEQIIYIGIRDIDDYEKKMIDELNIQYYDMTYIKQYGLSNILNNINSMHAPIHLSFDVDSMDPIYFKSTGTPVPRGLNKADAYNIFTTLKKNIVSTDIVEFNPYLSNNTIKHKEGLMLANLVKLT